MSNDFFNALFGPLPTEFCYLFVVFGAVALISLIISALSLLGLMVFSKSKIWMPSLPLALLNMILLGIVYVQNRLLYGMCVK